MRIPRVVQELAAVFADAGLECHLVGGAVRDILLGRTHTDFDIATNALPQRVAALFRRVIPTGIRHGTVTVLFKGATFEVTTYRTEGAYTDGRRPDSVTFAPSITDDLSRRDFTINAIAWDLRGKRLVDPHDGSGDIRRRLIRAIGVPMDRFREDGLRTLRACRFAAQLGFTVDPPTLAAIPGTLDVLARVSAERVRDELLKILAAPRPSAGLLLAKQTGILALILPELAEGDGVAQGDYHCHDVLVHSLMACDAAPAGSLLLRIAALLHDVGKPRTRGADGGRPTFHGHEAVSARLCAEILQRLKLPNAIVRDASHLVAHHMFNFQEEWTDAAVRRLVSRVGEEWIDSLVALRRADQAGMCPGSAATYPEGLVRFMARVQAVRAESRAFTLSGLAVNGNDVMERLSLPPGPSVGTILGQLLQAVLDDPAMNERERLLGMAEKLYRQRIAPGGAGT